MLQNQSKLSKEQIKNRMLVTASKVWGHGDTLNENQFDPLVSMMFSALASELEQVQNDIHSSQGRLLERLASMLLPDVFTAPQPSHAVVHAQPVEPKTIFKKNKHVYFKKNLPTISSTGKENTKDIFFTPTRDSILVNANIKYIASNKHIFKVLSAVEKELVAESMNAQDNETLGIWLGIDVSAGVGNFKGASLYFDYKNEVDKAKWYQLFDMCTASINEKNISLKKGIFQIHNSINYRLKSEQDISSKLENLVTEYYNQFFLHFDEVTNITKADLELYPPSFLQYYSSAQLAGFKENLVWLHLEYPAVLSNSQLPYLNISLNCFPAVNRKLQEKTYRLQENLNIVPLSVDDVFLDLVKIYSAKQFLYQENKKGEQDEIKAGSYTIRQGSIGRFDARNANEMLAYMMDLLKDESAAFSAMSTDMLQSNLKQLNQLISAIQQKLNLDSKRKDVATYLMIEPQTTHENIYIEYWVNQGIYANGIKQGTSLQQYQNSELKAGAIYTVTNTSNSKESLGPNEAINSFKASLLSRNRIVTEQDFIYACFADLGYLIDDVKVRTSFDSSHEHNEGFRKIILIELVPSSARNLKVDWDYACRQLELKLVQKTMQILPIKVKLYSK